MKWQKPNITWIIILLLAVFSVIFHLVFYKTFEYHRDELLYFSLGTHPAAGYATTPPLVGWLAYLLIKVLGYSLFTVKLVPALFSGGMVLLGTVIAKELGGKEYAMILAALSMIVPPLMLRAFFLFQPVFLDIFFWTLTFYFVIRYINTKNDNYLLVMGVVAGIGMLNKYLIALLFIGIILLLPFTRHRKVFKEKKMYAGLALAFILFLPNMVWQITHDLPVIGHMRALNDTQLVHVDRMGFLTEQLLMPSVAILLVVSGLLWLLISRRMKEYRLIALVALFTVLTLFLLRGKSYYTAGIFPVLIAAGAAFWDQILKRKIILIGLMVIMLVFTWPLLPIGLPVYKPDRMIEYFQKLEEEKGMDVGRRWEDGTVHPLPQDYADMLGWEELTRITKQAYDSIQIKKSAIIYAENYGQAGAISVIGKKYGLPEAMSFHDSYRYWLPLKLEHEITEFIYINNELGEDVEELFSDIVEVGRITNPYAREYGTRVYLCRKPLRSFNEFYYEILVERGVLNDEL